MDDSDGCGVGGSSAVDGASGVDGCANGVD
jgi:hypothetical protein